MDKYVIDLLLIALFGFSVFEGWRKGFVKALLSIAAVLISFFIACQLMVPLGAVVYDNFTRKVAVDAIEKYIDKNIGELEAGEYERDYDFDDIRQRLPDYVVEASEKLHISLEDILGKAELQELDSRAISEKLVDSVLHAPLLKASEGLAFVIAMAVSNAVLSIIVIVIDRFAKLPVLKQLNKGLGLGLGVLSGAIKVFIIAAIIGILAGVAGETSFARLAGSSVIVNAVAPSEIASSFIVK